MVKKRDDFDFYFNAIKTHLDDGYFSKSLVFYNDFIKSYQNLGSRKEDFSEDYELINSQLRLYMKIKEARMLLKMNKLDGMKLILRDISNLRRVISNGSRTFSLYAQDKENLLRKYFRAKISKNEIQRLLNETRNSLRRSDRKEVIGNYNNLVVHLKNLSLVDNSRETAEAYYEARNLREKIQKKLGY